jgi:hypothetical protein
LPGGGILTCAASSSVGRVSSIGSVLANGSSGSRLAAGVRNIRDGRCALECRLSLIGRRVSNGCVGRVEDLVDDVDNTVGNEDVGSDDTGVVHEDTAVTDGDGELLAVGSGEGSSVLKGGRVANGALSDDMVGKDAGSVLSAQVAKSGANVLESLVVGSEDCDVGSVVDGFKQLCRIDGSTETNKVGSQQCVGSVLRDSQHAVDDVNNTTGEVNILLWLAIVMIKSRGSTYSCCNSRVSEQTTEEKYIAISGDSLDDLAPSDVGEQLVGQQARYESARVGDVG